MTFEQELKELINKYSIESESDTPDFIVAQAVLGFLELFADAVNARDAWHGRGDT